MSTINNGGPAFPVVTRGNCEDGSNQFGHQFSHSTWQFPGMTLRDYFAAKAMQGMAASKEHCTDGWAHSDIAIQAYDLADAMLRARGQA